MDRDMLVFMMTGFKVESRDSFPFGGKTFFSSQQIP
jgi:hypothetical protein